jgi:DnaJ-class molecular chaperone
MKNMPDEIECFKCSGTGVNKKGHVCKKCRGTGKLNAKLFGDDFK